MQTAGALAIVGGVRTTSGCSAAALQDDPIELSTARQPNDGSDNNALAELLGAGHRNIRLSAGKGSGDRGAYLLGTAAGQTNIAGGLKLVGDGPGKTIVQLVQSDGDDVARFCAFFANSPSEEIENNLSDIVFSNFSLIDDPGRRRGFKENQNLIWLNGVSRLLIENIALAGFRGDGIMIGAGHLQVGRRHNFAVTLRNLVLDGVDRNTRNGVSVIDCDGFTAENILGENVARPGDGTAAPPSPLDPNKGLGMPGLIDFEPDNPWNVVRNVKLRNVHARNCGGSAVALLLRSNAAQSNPHQNFDIEFTAEGCDQGFSHTGYRDESIGGAAAIPYNITIRGRVSGARKAAFRLDGTYGATIALDVHDSADAYIGDNARPLVGTREISLAGSRFVGGGNRNGNAITIDGSSRSLAIDTVRFENCGIAGTRRCLFIRGGNHVGLTFQNNVVVSAQNMTQIAGVMGGFAGRIDRRTCVNRDNASSAKQIQEDNF